MTTKSQTKRLSLFAVLLSFLILPLVLAFTACGEDKKPTKLTNDMLNEYIQAGHSTFVYTGNYITFDEDEVLAFLREKIGEIEGLENEYEVFYENNLHASTASQKARVTIRAKQSAKHIEGQATGEFTITKAINNVPPTEINEDEFGYRDALNFTVIPDAGTLGVDTVTFKYSTNYDTVTKQGTWQDLPDTTQTPLELGVYYVKAIIPGTDDYVSVEGPVQPFSVVQKQLTVPFLEDGQTWNELDLTYDEHKTAPIIKVKNCQRFQNMAGQTNALMDWNWSAARPAGAEDVNLRWQEGGRVLAFIPTVCGEYRFHIKLVDTNHYYWELEDEEMSRLQQVEFVVRYNKADNTIFSVSPTTYTYVADVTQAPEFSVVATSGAANATFAFADLVDGDITTQPEDTAFGPTRPTNAGTYWVRATIAESNYYKQAVYYTTFTIEPQQVAEPTFDETTAVKPYDGKEKTFDVLGFDEEALTYAVFAKATQDAEYAPTQDMTGTVVPANNAASKLVLSAKKAAFYKVEIKLNNPTGITNYVWAHQEGEEPSTVSISFEMQIEKTTQDNEWRTQPSINAEIVYGTQATEEAYGLVRGEALYAAEGEPTVSLYEGTYNEQSQTWSYETLLSDLPTAVGHYKAVFTVAETADYDGLEEEILFQIVKANNSWTTEPTATSKIYDGTAVTVTAGTAVFGGDARTYTYYNAMYDVQTQTYTKIGDPLAQAPVNVENYVVVVSIAGTESYNALETELGFTISKAQVALVTATSQTSFPYNGNPQNITLSTYDSTIVDVTNYQEQTNAGNYTVYIDLIDKANYEWTDHTTTQKSIEWQITRLNNEIHEFTPSAAAATYTGENLISGLENSTFVGAISTTGAISYAFYDTNEGTPLALEEIVNAGAYYAKITIAQSTNYNAVTSDFLPFTVAKVAITAPSFTNDETTLSVEFDEIGQAITIKNFDGDKMNAGTPTTGSSFNGGTWSATNAGVYTITLTPKANYEFSGDAQSVTLTLTITRKVVTNADPVQSETLTYTGQAQSPTWDYTPGQYTIAEASETNAGSYDIVLTATDNYCFGFNESTPILTKTIEDAWTIAVAKVAVPVQNKALTYDGTQQTPEWTGFDVNKMSTVAEGSILSSTDAGTFNMIFALIDTDNYAWDLETPVSTNQTAQWTIGKRTLTKPTISGETSFVYTGEEQGPEVNLYGQQPAWFSVTGDQQATTVGAYQLTYEIANTNNCEWAGESSVVFNWSITKATTNNIEISGTTNFAWQSNAVIQYLATVGNSEATIQIAEKYLGGDPQTSYTDVDALMNDPDVSEDVKQRFGWQTVSLAPQELANVWAFNLGNELMFANYWFKITIAETTNYVGAVTGGAFAILANVFDMAYSTGEQETNAVAMTLADDYEKVDSKDNYSFTVTTEETELPYAIGDLVKLTIYLPNGMEAVTSDVASFTDFSSQFEDFMYSTAARQDKIVVENQNLQLAVANGKASVYIKFPIPTEMTGGVQYYEYIDVTFVLDSALVTTEAELTAALADTSVDIVQLGADISITSGADGMDVSRSLTLDLNGHTFTSTCSEDALWIHGTENNSIDVVIANGTIDASIGNIFYIRYATVTLNGGHYIERTAGKTGIMVVEDATLVVNNAQIEAVETCIVPYTNSEVIINGGTFASTDNFVVGTSGGADYGGNTITINDGTFNGSITSTGYIACGVCVANNDTIIINGGTFNITDGIGILARSGNTTIGEDVVINATGTISGKIGKRTLNINAGDEIVWDLDADYPGGVPTITNNTQYEVVAYVNTAASLASAYDTATTMHINSLAGLEAIRDAVNGGTSFEGKVVKLDADINLNNQEWVPIGYGTCDNGNITQGITGPKFMGTFDGLNHTISNLKITNFTLGGEHEGASAGVGLFGQVVCGVIQNLNIDGAVVVGNHWVGALAGFVSHSTINNCSVINVDVSCVFANDDESGDKAGALIGYISGDYTNIYSASFVTNCSATDSTVNADRDAGQVIGCTWETVDTTGTTADASVVVTGNNTSSSAKSGQNINNTIVGRVAS